MQLNEARAVITGGASGLGLATAERVIAAGGQVTLMDVSRTQGEAACQALGSQSHFSEVDVAQETAVDSAMAEAARQMGGINLVVNCAGVAWPKKMLGKDGIMPGDFFRKVVDINLVGTLLVCKAAAATMQTNVPNKGGERGVIVLTASVAAFEGQIGQVAYSASKAGVTGMTLPMAREFAAYGIRVVTIAPGLFQTPMVAGLPQQAQESLARQVPFPPRLGQPTEYADLVKSIFENAMLNGTTIRIDGAIRMQPR